MPAPSPIAYHRYGFARRQILGGFKGSAQGRADAEHFEIVRRDDLSKDLIVRRIDIQKSFFRDDRGKSGDRVKPVPETGILAPRERRTTGAVDGDGAVRLGDGQSAKIHLVEPTEHRSIYAYAERQANHGGRRVARTAVNYPHRIVKIALYSGNQPAAWR